jgi:hypothetical protein
VKHTHNSFRQNLFSFVEESSLPPWPWQTGECKLYSETLPQQNILRRYADSIEINSRPANGAHVGGAQRANSFEDSNPRSGRGTLMCCRRSYLVQGAPPAFCQGRSTSPRRAGKRLKFSRRLFSFRPCGVTRAILIRRSFHQLWPVVCRSRIDVIFAPPGPALTSGAFLLGLQFVPGRRRLLGRPSLSRLRTPDRPLRPTVLRLPAIVVWVSSLAS